MNNTDIPRRIRLDKMTPAELAITDAMEAVEKLPGDVRLTEAVVLLDRARNLVADFVDDPMNNPVCIASACARAAHEANRAYCLAICNDTQPSWDDAPLWQKVSAVAGVDGALAGNTPEQSHKSWMAQKVADGWKYGPAKDPEKKEHPCMVPYSELPPEQRAKDDIFLAVVRAVAAALNRRPEEP
jgi:hypothetical protein